MGAWLSLAVLILAGFAGLKLASLPWLYFAAVLAFEGWLFGIVRSVAARSVAPGEPPYRFDADEARLVERYPFYFTFPGIARHSSSVLAAVGLSSLLLAPWLTFRMAYVPALIAAANLLPVAWLTRRTAPTLALGLAANRGNREAMQLLSAHGTAWEKIRQANQSPAR